MNPFSIGPAYVESGRAGEWFLFATVLSFAQIAQDSAQAKQPFQFCGFLL